MDGCNDNGDIANIFSDKYMELYNSVPYDTSEMRVFSPIRERADNLSLMKKTLFFHSFYEITK